MFGIDRYLLFDYLVKKTTKKQLYNAVLILISK